MPDSDLVLLLDVSHPYREALEGWGREQQIALMASEGDLSSASPYSVTTCVMSVRASDPNPVERIQAVRKLLRSRPVIVLGESITVDLAMRLTSLGVADVLKLPTSPQRVVARVARHVGDLRGRSLGDELVGQSPGMRALREAVRDAGRAQSNVLLCGETGTGKALVARQIHEGSTRREDPFIHVDCRGFSADATREQLVRELTDRSGHDDVDSWEAGTVFLEEIQELAQPVQASLVSVVDESRRSLRRVAGRGARFIASTTDDLVEAVQARRFRPDLYYRLNVLKLEIPPLRERLSDIPELVHEVVESLAGRLGIPTPEVAPGFFERLFRHDWPGNVRELVNVLERVLVRAPVQVLDEDLLEGALEAIPGLPIGRGPKPKPNIGDANEIAAVLVATGGNISRAARRLGIPRSTLRYRIRLHNLTDLVPRD